MAIAVKDKLVTVEGLEVILGKDASGEDVESTYVKKTDVVNNLTTTDSGKSLDARQGKALKDAVDAKVATADVANDLTTTDVGKVLDARQGKALKDAVDAKVSTADVANDLTTTVSGKVLDARQGKALMDAVDEKLDADFSYPVAPTPFNGSEKVALSYDGDNYSTDMATILASAGGGAAQCNLTNYTKNCGTISSLPTTINDNNITADMVVLESTLSNPSAQISDWDITTANGSVTISGSISGSTNLILYFGVGMATAPNIWINLASASADNILKSEPRPGVYGVLGVANGGTGGNDAATARTNLDVYSKSEVNNAIQQSAAYIDLNVGGTAIDQVYDGAYYCTKRFTADVPSTFRCINANPAPNSWWTPAARVVQCVWRDSNTVEISFASTKSVTLASNCIYRIWYR